MKTAKLGAMFLVSLMALAGIGASYSAWADTLTMNGTVNTGTVDVEFIAPSAFGDGDAGYEISSITAWLVDMDTMRVVVTNAYPCIDYFFDFGIHNAGTIPVQFHPGWVISDLSAFITITGRGGDPNTPVALDSTGNWVGHFNLHLDDTFTQGTTYTFTITLTGHQYNL